MFINDAANRYDYTATSVCRYKLRTGGIQVDPRPTRFTPAERVPSIHLTTLGSPLNQFGRGRKKENISALPETEP